MGKLKAFKTAGGHNRVHSEELLKFLKKNKIPIPKELAFSTKKVLVVDDDSKIIKTIQEAFDAFSKEFKVEGVTNGIAALISIGALKPDVVVLDLMLPQLDGFEVCEKIRENSQTEHIKIVAISGTSDEVFKKRILDTGADAFLEKPFNIIELLGVVSDLTR